jgi:tRNA threonylcarbamoyladenosine biosynthesis protein TsaE
VERRAPAIEMETSTRSRAETIALGRRIGALLPRPARVLLHGEMGAGKTAFAKGLYAGVSGEDAGIVTSPTYTLVNAYETGAEAFYHVDLFRLERPEQICSIDAEELMIAHAGVTVVEWPALVEAALAIGDALRIEIILGATPDARSIRLAATGPSHAKVLEALAR